MFLAIMMELVSKMFDMNIDTCIDMIGGYIPMDMTLLLWILGDIVFVAICYGFYLSDCYERGKDPLTITIKRG